jgi:hypothetical protein
MAIGVVKQRVVRAARLLLTALGLVLAGNACIGGVCTLEGCDSAAYVEIRREGAWWEGTYTLELVVDDAEPRSATFVVPDDLPEGGWSKGIAFGDDQVRASLSQRSMCSSTHSPDGNSGSGSCTPIPDEYDVSLELAGNPKTIGITLTRDDQTLLADERSPKYERNYPNGSDCDEGCSQGSYELTFED